MNPLSSVFSVKEERFTMHWEIEIRPRHGEEELEGEQLARLLSQKTQRDPGPIQSGRVYLISGLEETDVQRVVSNLLVDPTVERAEINRQETAHQETILTILPKPGVMDPVAGSIEFVISQLGL